MKSECKYCGRKEMIDGIGICCSCNDAYLDGQKAGIEHAQYVIRTALGMIEERWMKEDEK